MGLLYLPVIQLNNANSKVYPGSKLYTYLAGTSTLTETYSDALLTTEHTNPVIADAAGKFPQIFGDTNTAYKLVLRDKNDVVLETWDNVFGILDPTTVASPTGNIYLVRGTETSPSYSWDEDRDTGLFLKYEGSPESLIGIGLSVDGDEKFVFRKTGGIIRSSIANYEDFMTDDNDFPNKKYIDDTVLSGVAYPINAPIGLITSGSPLNEVPYAFDGNTKTGMYLPVTGSPEVPNGLGFKVNGTETLHLNLDNSINAYEYTFIGDVNTGLISGGDGVIRLQSNGTKVLDIDAYSSSDSDITGLVSGTTSGTLLRGYESGHVVVGIKGNDGTDGFHVIRDSDTGSPDVYDDLLFSATGNQVIVPPGGLTFAGLSFQGDPDTGLAQFSSNQINLVGGGTNLLYANTTEVVIPHLLYCTAGSASAPGIAFTADHDTGMYRVSSNVLGFTTGVDLNFQTFSGRIDADCNIFPINDNTRSIGNGSFRWVDVWAVDGSINTSDLRDKTDIADTNLGLDFILDLRPVEYKWKKCKNVIDCNPTDEEQFKSIVEIRKGKRPHQGLIAQEVKQVMDKHNIEDFAGYVYDDEADSYSLRYNEFIAPLIKSIQQLTARVNHLEKQLQKK